MILNALSAVLMVFIIMAVGYFMGKGGWAGPEVTSFISKFITNITVPFTIVYTFISSIPGKELAGSWAYIAASFISIIIAVVIGKLVARAAKVDAKRRGIFICLFAFSNSIFIGLPIATAIFGEGALLYAIYYYVANTVMMNSLGVIELERDRCAIQGDSSGTSARLVVKSLLKPPLLAAVAGIALSLLGVTEDMLPDFLTSALRYVGNITSPLALIFVGMALHRMGISCIKRIDKPLALSLVGRFIVSPLTMILATALFGIHGQPAHILTIQMSLPAMISISIYSENIGADTDFAARGIVVSTLLSFVTIPLYILILT